MKLLKFKLRDPKRDKRALIILCAFLLLIFIVIVVVIINRDFRDKEEVLAPEKTEIIPKKTETIEEVVPLKYSDLTEEQLQEYFRVYEDPFVVTLRKGLNGYLDGTNEGTDDPEFLINGLGDNSNSGLAAFGKDYYKSKFVVLYIDYSPVGGKNIHIIFQDKPDKKFWAWVYDNHIEDGSYDRYNLRGFQEFPLTEQEIQVMLTTYKEFIEDKEHSL